MLQVPTIYISEVYHNRDQPVLFATMTVDVKNNGMLINRFELLA